MAVDRTWTEDLSQLAQLAAPEKRTDDADSQFRPARKRDSGDWRLAFEHLQALVDAGRAEACLAEIDRAPAVLRERVQREFPPPRHFDNRM